MKVWNSKTHSAEDALELPKGSYVAEIFEQSVEPRRVIRGAVALMSLEDPVTIYSQAEAIVKAQELGVEFADEMTLRLL